MMTETRPLSERLEQLLVQQGKHVFSPLFAEDKAALAKALEVPPSDLWGAIAQMRKRHAGEVGFRSEGESGSVLADLEMEDMRGSIMRHVTALSPSVVPPAHLILRLVYVTPEIAEEWLTRCFDRQRSLRTGHVAMLARAMDRGEFEETTITFAVCGGEWHLTDGQHRLHAIIRSGKAQWLGVLFKFVNDAQRIADAYVRTDAQLARTLSDRARAHGGAKEAQLSETQYLCLLRAVTLIMAGFQARPTEEQLAALRSAEAKIQFAEEWTKEAAEYRSLTAGATTNLGPKCWNGATMSVALVTLRHTPEKAKEFWQRVAHDDGLAAGTPEKRLVEFLLTQRMLRKEREIDCRRVAHCWNAYVWNKNTRGIHIADAKEPIVIAGSPYDGTTVRE